MKVTGNLRPLQVAGFSGGGGKQPVGICALISAGVISALPQALDLGKKDYSIAGITADRGVSTGSQPTGMMQITDRQQCTWKHPSANHRADPKVQVGQSIILPVLLEKILAQPLQATGVEWE
jgi:hypothetical protein